MAAACKTRPFPWKRKRSHSMAETSTGNTVGRIFVFMFIYEIQSCNSLWRINIIKLFLVIGKA